MPYWPDHRRRTDLMSGIISSMRKRAGVDVETGSLKPKHEVFGWPSFSWYMVRGTVLGVGTT